MITRRRLLTALGASALTTPLAGFPQSQRKLYRVGFLSPRSRSAPPGAEPYDGFAQGMGELGYVEGRDYTIEWRFAHGAYDRLPELAADLVRSKVDVILAASSPAIRAAQQASSTVPIVMGSTGDAVASGFVKSLSQPGGNTTGLSTATADVSAKQLELLLAAVPKASRIGVLGNPASSTYRVILKSLQPAAQRLSIQLIPAEVRAVDDLRTQFTMLERERVDALFVAQEALVVLHRKEIADLAIKYRLPTVTATRENAEAGAMMSYGQDLLEDYRRSAAFVDKILKGAKPENLPVEQPTRLELVVNLKTAKAIGVTVPASVLFRADKVIE